MKFHAICVVVLLLVGCAQPRPESAGRSLEGFTADARSAMPGPIRLREPLTYAQESLIEVSGDVGGTPGSVGQSPQLSMASRSEKFFWPGNQISAELKIEQLRIESPAIPLTAEEREILRQATFHARIEWDADCKNPVVGYVRVASGSASDDLPKFRSYIEVVEADSIACLANGAAVGTRVPLPVGPFFTGREFDSVRDRISGTAIVRVTAVGTYAGRDAVSIDIDGDAKVPLERAALSGNYRATFVFDARSGVIMGADVGYALGGRDTNGKPVALASKYRTKTLSVR